MPVLPGLRSTQAMTSLCVLDFFVRGTETLCIRGHFVVLLLKIPPRVLVLLLKIPCGTLLGHLGSSLPGTELFLVFLKG